MTATMLSVPIGTIIDYAGPNAPAGYLECDGSAVPRADYPALFAALGGTSSPWGLPDSTHFNLPDLRGRTAIGAGTGTAGGATAHALASKGGDERMQAHKHAFRANKNDAAAAANRMAVMKSTGFSWVTKWENMSEDDNSIVLSSGRGSSQNMQPYAVVRKLIRAA